MKTLMRIIQTTTVIIALPFFATANNDEGTKPSKNEKTSSALKIAIVDLQHPSCEDGSNGMIQVRAEGGLAPYTYNWNSFPNQFSEKATDLTPGVYFIHVEDAMGQKFYQSVELIAESSDVQFLSETDYSVTAANKLIEFSQLKNEGKCTVKLNGMEVDKVNARDLEIGIHKVEITDENQCTTKRFIQVYQMINQDGEIQLPLETTKETILSKKN